MEHDRLAEEEKERDRLCGKKRIVIKIGSSSLTHEGTGDLNLGKIEKLIRVISDLKGEGKMLFWFRLGRSLQADRHLDIARNRIPYLKNRHMLRWDRQD